MTVLFDIFTFIVLSIVAIRHIWRILRTGRPSSVGLLYIVLFFAYGMPLLYRYILPMEHIVGSFAVAMESPAVRLRYNLVLLVGVFLLWLTSIRRPAIKAKEFSWSFADINWGRLQFFACIGWLGLLLPILIILVMAPEKTAYLKYGGATTRALYSPLARFTFALVQYATIFALACYFFIRSYQYYSKGRFWTFHSFLATVVMTINCYLDGKRAMLLIFVLSLGFFNLLHKASRKMLIVAVPIVLIFFFVYMSFGKPPEISTRASYIGFIRGDLARDYTLSYTISRTDWTKNEIMPNRGNSFIWIATAYIPRRILTSKVWTTSQHFTSAVYGQSVVDWVRNYRWGYGIGYFEEFLLNYGYLGLLLFIPLGLLLRGLDHLIYRRSAIYSVLWIPILYNAMFAINATLRMYVALAIPVLLVYGLSLRKIRQTEHIYYESQGHSDIQYEAGDDNFTQY